MHFGDIFERPIDRHLDGVIKPDETEYLKSELEEYVLTPEIRRCLLDFCEEYASPHAEGNGAWISGFYGSGKSHLLKILSYVLEDAEVAGKPALDYITPKVPEGDAALRAALVKACERIPSQSILFNIGGKADSSSRDNDGALLSAFIKVLNERCGYFDGAQAHVAKLERDLDREGLYQAFVEEFESSTGMEWTKARANALIYAKKISASYDRATGNPEGTNSNIVETYSRDYHPSAEDFATWANEYIERMDKERPGFRLNFFADEMGQFIAKNEVLLFALQNVAELLSTKCHGRAWVIVTSQEDVESFVGEMQSHSANDFSKIQARFKVKMKIPSNDANAVVRDRLLEKRPEALGPIAQLYQRYSGDFQVLFDFADGAKRYLPYSGMEDFEATYPLVPYQFDLFHAALESLSNHGCFSGEYSSTGARNMLSATRNVLLATKDTGDVGSGDLISFDMMFDGLRGELQSTVYGEISLAENQLGDELGVRILKALLLVKYNEEFKATPSNLRILLYGGFSENSAELERRITSSLDELERQNYVRRNGTGYEYLTNEEKDIEEEIKKLPVDYADVSRGIGGLITDDLGTRKVQYANGPFRTPFGYDVLVDGQAVTPRRNELSLNVLTPLTDNPLARTAGMARPKELLCVLPDDAGLVKEMRLYLQTDKYVKLHGGAGGATGRILSEKSEANSTRYVELKAKVSELLDGATWATCGTDVTSQASGSGTARVASEMLVTVAMSYPHLAMLTTDFSDASIYNASKAGEVLPGMPLPEYCEETLDEISRVLAQSDVCTVGGTGSNSLEKALSAGQHGWPPQAVRQAVGVLAKNGRVACSRNDAPLAGTDLASALSKGNATDTITVRPLEEIGAEKLAEIRDAYKAVTGQTAVGDDARRIADELGRWLADRLDDYGKLASKAYGMPFSARYQDRLSTLRELAGRTQEWLIEHAAAAAGAATEAVPELRDMAEFLNGTPYAIFAEAEGYLREQAANISACPDAQALAGELEKVLSDEDCYRDGAAPQAKKLQRQMEDVIDAALEASRSRARGDIESFAEGFRKEAYASASEEARAKADAIIAQATREIDSMTQIQIADRAIGAFKDEHAPELLSIVAPKGTEDAPAPEVRTVRYSKVSKPASFDRPTLSSPDDVDAFVGALRQDLLSHVSSGETIIL